MNTQKRKFTVWAGVGLVLALVLGTVILKKPSSRYIALTGYAQGGTYTVKLNIRGEDGKFLCDEKVLKAGVDSILRLVDNSLSGYNEKSLLSRFNAGEKIKANDCFIDLYERSYGFYEQTGGAVDVASAPLFDIWGFGFTTDSLPEPALIESMLDICGMDRLEKDMAGCLETDGSLQPFSLLAVNDESWLPKLNYNAVAQGYTCDLIASYLYSFGVKDMLVDVGGEIYCDGHNPSGNQWMIGVDRPVDGNMQKGADIQAVFKVPEGPKGVVTSGNYRKFYMKDGRKFSHTIDPRTGYPVQHSLLSATIMTEADATAADAYATYCMVIGLEEAVKFIESSDGVEGYLVYDDAGTMKSWSSNGFVISEIVNEVK